MLTTLGVGVNEGRGLKWFWNLSEAVVTFYNAATGESLSFTCIFVYGFLYYRAEVE